MAGIIEAADLFLINKADLPGSETLLDSLRFLFDISPRQEMKSIPPVLTASAVRDEGMDEVHAETERLIQDLLRSERHLEKKRRQMEHEIRAAIQQNLWEEFASLTNAQEEIRLTSARLLRDGESPYPYIRRTCSRIKLEIKDEGA